MMTATTLAGQSARTTTDAPHPQNSRATTCDECEHRPADGMNPDGRSLCRACATREGTLVCDGGIDLETRKEELQAAIAEIPDADPETLTLYDAGHGHFVINSDEEDQDVADIDEALDGTSYERNGIVNPPGMTQQNIQPVEEGEADE